MLTCFYWLLRKKRILKTLTLVSCPFQKELKYLLMKAYGPTVDTFGIDSRTLGENKKLREF